MDDQSTLIDDGAAAAMAKFYFPVDAAATTPVETTTHETSRVEDVPAQVPVEIQTIIAQPRTVVAPVVEEAVVLVPALIKDINTFQGKAMLQIANANGELVETEVEFEGNVIRIGFRTYNRTTFELVGAFGEVKSNINLRVAVYKYFGVSDETIGLNESASTNAQLPIVSPPVVPITEPTGLFRFLRRPKHGDEIALAPIPVLEPTITAHEIPPIIDDVDEVVAAELPSTEDVTDLPIVDVAPVVTLPTLPPMVFAPAPAPYLGATPPPYIPPVEEIPDVVVTLVEDVQLDDIPDGYQRVVLVDGASDEASVPLDFDLASFLNSANGVAKAPVDEVEAVVPDESPALEVTPLEEIPDVVVTLVEDVQLDDIPDAYQRVVLIDVAPDEASVPLDFDLASFLNSANGVAKAPVDEVLAVVPDESPALEVLLIEETPVVEEIPDVVLDELPVIEVSPVETIEPVALQSEVIDDSDSVWKRIEAAKLAHANRPPSLFSRLTARFHKDKIINPPEEPAEIYQNEEAEISVTEPTSNSLADLDITELLPPTNQTLSPFSVDPVYHGETPEKVSVNAPESLADRDMAEFFPPSITVPTVEIPTSDTVGRTF